MAAYGPENIKDHFAAFDTICDATQVRQDAVLELSTDALSAEAGQDLDFILVVGGWDSSNTCHLLEIPHEQGLLGYHVNEAKCIRPDNAVEWRDVDGNILVTESFLPLDRPVRIGVTSGASTPDSVVQECLEAIVMVKQLASEEMIAGSGEPHTYSEADEEASQEHDEALQSSDVPSGASIVEAAAEMAPPGFAWGGTY